MVTFADYLYEVERRKDEIAQAEQHRLRQRISGRNSGLKKGYHKALGYLGALLVAWGCGLQARFAPESKASPRKVRTSVSTP